MALKPWHTIGLTAAGMALAAVVILPPRPLPLLSESGGRLRLLFEGQVYNYQSGANYKWSLSSATRQFANRVFAARKADSLLTLAAGSRALHGADGALTVVYEPELTADSARFWLRMLERELALAPHAPGGGVPLIVELRAVDSARKPHSWSDYVMMRFVSPRAERPACFVSLRLVRGMHGYDVTRIVERDRRTGAARTAVLDWCLAYARFGTPGSQVSKWAGHRVQLTYSYNSGSTFTWALDAERQGRLADHEDTWMGEAYESWGDPTYAGCVRGSRPLCLASVGLVSDAPELDGSWTGLARPRLLASLMLKDPERFGRFWRSPEPPTVALETAFGRPAADLVADWERSVFTLRATGPRVLPRALLSSLGWAALAIGLGLFAAGRRQVDS
jgi:hypothetical protein